MNEWLDFTAWHSSTGCDLCHVVIHRTSLQNSASCQSPYLAHLSHAVAVVDNSHFLISCAFGASFIDSVPGACSVIELFGCSRVLCCRRASLRGRAASLLMKNLSTCTNRP